MIKIEDVIHVSSIEEVKGQIEGIKTINLSEYLGLKPLEDSEMVFVGKEDRIVGIYVENAENVVSIDMVSPFEKDIFMVDFILNVVSFDGKMGYLIDSDKMLEVAYEQESSPN